jgi:hypothetical protein
MAINDLREQVEQRLQEAQKNKTFKDVGRVADLKKTKAAYKLIDVSILSEIEADEVQAFNLVKKDMVWQAIDVNAERERGVTAGAAWLKTKIREAVPTKPDNSKSKRESYVLFLTKLQADLLNCFNVNDIEQLAERYRKFSITDIIGYIVDSSYLGKDAEQRQAIEEGIKKGYRIAMIYGASRLMRQLIEEVFSKRFHNMLFKSGDTAYATYRESIEKEPVSDEVAAALKTKLIGRKQLFIESNEAKIVEYSNFSHEELKVRMNRDWNLHSMNLALYKKDIELFRKWATDYYKRQIERGITEYDVKIKDAVVKENDWSWFETPKEKGTRVVDQSKLTINKKEPLAYIKRTGGFAIGEVSAAQLMDSFGYKAVNYGNYVDDKWSKQHTKFFLQAMSDLGEIYNINIKELNELGGLGIVFGGKGTKGHLATYYPQSKDINLTKANGDGSVCHEYGHYFDNVVIELAEKKPIPSLASEKLNAIQNEELKSAYIKLIDFFNKGKEEITPKLKVKFLAKDSVSVPTYSKRVNNSWEQVEVKIKPTIEETIAEYKDLLVLGDKYYTTQLRVLGYVISKFGLDNYEVELKLNTSMFYQKSAYDYFTYCYLTPTKDVSKFETKMGVQRRTPYWTSNVEMFARAWETVMLKKLIDRGRRSDYLVSGIDLTDLNVEGFQNPYPSGMELDYIEGLFENIISAAKKAYNLSDFKPYIDEREDMLIEFESKKKPVVESGIDVVKTKTKEVVEFVKENKVAEVVVEEKKEDVKPIEMGTGEEFVGKTFQIFQTLIDRKGKPKDFSDVSKITSLNDGKLSYKTDNDGAGFISVRSFYDKLNSGQAVEVQSESNDNTELEDLIKKRNTLQLKALKLFAGSSLQRKIQEELAPIYSRIEELQKKETPTDVNEAILLLSDLLDSNSEELVMSAKDAIELLKDLL